MGYRPGPAGLGLVFEVIEDLLDHPRVFDTGNHLDRTGAFPAGLDIDVENTFEPLCPGHRRSPFGWRWRLIGYPSLMPPAPLWGRHPRPVLAVRRNHPWQPVKLTPGLGTRLTSLTIKSSGSKITSVRLANDGNSIVGMV